MAQDNTNYEIVQISEADWGIQYADGTLLRGYQSRQEAIDNAQTIAAEPTEEIESSRPYVPKNLNEALVIAQSTRDSYREFIGANPTATQEQKDAQAAQILAADAYVSEFQAQSAQAARESLANDDARRAQLDMQEQLANAEARRNQTASDAILARQNREAVGYTDQDIQDFDNDAFSAETYYENLRNQQTTASQSSSTDSAGDGSVTSLFSGGSREVVNFGGQVTSGSASQSGVVSNSNDTITTTLNSQFGSIQTSGLTSNSTATGYGSSSSSGTTVYDTNVGVTAVASSSDQRVKISPKPTQRSAILTGVLAPLAATGGLVFPFTPQITMQASTNYNTLEPVQSNQDYQIYQNTPSIDISISGIFTAQNDTEAKYLLACAHFLRVFTKMHFGSSDENAGLPPPQLILDGYGTYMFNGLSVILRSYEMNLPDNVDYVTVNLNNGTSKVPTMTTLTVMVTVQQTPSKARTFEWDSFATGSLMQQKGWL